MRYSVRSIWAFCVFLGILGFALVLFPDPILTLLGLPPAKDYWILVAGMLLVGLSIYYAYAAHEKLTSFMRLTAIMRSLVLPYFLVLVMTDRAPLPILIIGVIDLIFAGWTFIGLKLDESRTRLQAA